MALVQRIVADKIEKSNGADYFLSEAEGSSSTRLKNPYVQGDDGLWYPLLAVTQDGVMVLVLGDTGVA